LAACVPSPAAIGHLGGFWARLHTNHTRGRGVPLARERTIAERANVIALPRPDRELLGDATHLQLTLVRS
jgi:hypothetical protein